MLWTSIGTLFKGAVSDQKGLNKDDGRCGVGLNQGEWRVVIKMIGASLVNQSVLSSFLRSRINNQEGPGLVEVSLPLLGQSDNESTTPMG